MRKVNQRVLAGVALLVFVASTASLPAQECSNDVVVGNFSFVASEPVYDGTQTTFEYCATGLGGDDFHALSHWSLSLCAPGEFFASCDTGGEGACDLETDPHTGIEGVKFDDIEVENGETQCFSLSLLGNWTGKVGEVALGLKAAEDVELGLICGPICEGCVAALDVTAAAGEIPNVAVVLRHQIPPDISTRIWFRVFDESRNRVHSWVDGPVDFEYGTVYSFLGPMPDLVEPLAPGQYQLKMGIRGMSGFRIVTRAFVVPAE